MSRTLDAASIVQLPTLSAHEANVLGNAIEAAALDEKGKPRKLSEAVREALDEVKADRTALAAELGPVVVEDAKVRPVDIREDRAVGAIHDVLLAWARLAEEIPEGATAAALVARLFPNGVGFVLLAPRQEWSEVQSRLDTIQREQLEPNFHQLGAGPMLALLNTIHLEYGRVTGATAALTLRESPQIRTRRNALADSIRHYVTAVLGSVVRKKPETKALADILLRPIAEWESRPRARKEGAPAPQTTQVAAAGGAEAAGGEKTKK